MSKLYMKIRPVNHASSGMHLALFNVTIQGIIEGIPSKALILSTEIWPISSRPMPPQNTKRNMSKIFRNCDKIYNRVLIDIMSQVHLPRQPFHTTYECNLDASCYVHVQLHCRARYRLQRPHHEKWQQRREHHIPALRRVVPVTLICVHYLHPITRNRHLLIIMRNLALTAQRTSPGSIRIRVMSCTHVGVEIRSTKVWQFRGTSPEWQPIALVAQAGVSKLLVRRRRSFWVPQKCEAKFGLPCSNFLCNCSPVSLVHCRVLTS